MCSEKVGYGLFEIPAQLNNLSCYASTWTWDGSKFAADENVLYIVMGHTSCLPAQKFSHGKNKRTFDSKGDMLASCKNAMPHIRHLINQINPRQGKLNNHTWTDVHRLQKTVSVCE